MSSKLSVVMAGGKNGDPINACLQAGMKLVKFEAQQTSEMDADYLAGNGVEALVYRTPFGTNVYRSVSPAEFAAAIPDKLLQCAMAKKLCEFDNEPVVKTADDIAVYAQRLSAFCDLVHARGGLVAGFSWSTFNPASDVLDAITSSSALQQAAAKCDAHAFHEYYRADAGWGAALRCLQFEGRLPDWARRPIVITETGWDDNGDPDTGGFSGKVSESQYLAIMQDYDRLIGPYAQILAATMFQQGGDWWSFNLDEFLPNYLAPHVRSVGGGAPLVWTVSPEPPEPEKPIVELLADCTHIQAGDSVTLTWNVEHVQAYYLDGEPMTGDWGSRSYTLQASRQFVLRAVLLDGTEQLAIVDVTVDAVPSDATEPADPHLRAFPRPLEDNGIGMHFGLDCRPQDLALHLPMLAALRVKWVLFYTTSPDQAVACVQAALGYGMQPIIRPKARIDEPFDFGAYARACPGRYIQIYNEWGNDREWKSGHAPSDYIAVASARWRAAAQDVAAAGALPGLQVMGAEEAHAALDGLPSLVAGNVWMASHSYPSNHPPDYPYDARNQAEHPGATVFDDDVTQLHFLLDIAWAKECLGFDVPVIVCEGGYQYQQLEDARYPRIGDAEHAQNNVALYEQFRAGRLANGDPLPDNLFAICPWLWSHPDWTAWYAGIDGTRQPTIDAVTAIPPFVRTFGGATPPVPPEPPDDPELEEAIAAATRATQALQDALVDMDGVLGYLRSLRSD